MKRTEFVRLALGLGLGAGVLGVIVSYNNTKRPLPLPADTEIVGSQKPAVIPSSSSSLVPIQAEVAPEDLQKISILKEIFKSKNDNDPRMDRELRVLSESAKVLMLQQYRSLEAEKRNERGTIVFLLGRNLRTEADFEFLCEVIREPPCFSLKNCAGEPSTVGREDFEHESGEEITLAYPQIVALRVLQDYLTAGSRSFASAAMKALQCAKDSRVGAVQAQADQVNQAISKHSSGF